MSKKDAVQVVESHPADLLSVIAHAVADPRMDVEKMRALFELQRDIQTENNRIAFVEAMARLAPKLPEIDKNGRVKFEGKDGKAGQDRKYARLEDIDRAIRPLYSEEGFSLSWNTGEGVGGKIRVIGTLSHCKGHVETRQLDLPYDSSGSKNPVQAVGSTVSYGKRMITTMLFNIITKDEDTDGENLTPITEDQARDLESAIEEVRMDKGKFLVYMHVGSVREILQRDLATAVNAIDVKRRGVK